jgi:nicotinamidase-related amidase
MEKPVFVVIDMVPDFLESWEPLRRETLVNSINQLVGIACAFSRPVIWIRQEFEPDLRDGFSEMKTKRIHIAIKGTPGCEISGACRCFVGYCHR